MVVIGLVCLYTGLKIKQGAREESPQTEEKEEVHYIRSKTCVVFAQIKPILNGFEEFGIYV